MRDTLLAIDRGQQYYKNTRDSENRRPKVRRGFGAATAHCLQRGRARDMGAITRFLRAWNQPM